MPCANCTTQTCFTARGEPPAGCPDLEYKDVIAATSGGEDFRAHVKSNQRDDLDRIRELIAYAKFKGYKKVGIAGCIGLHDEMRIVTQVLKKEGGLDVSTVMCKSGAVHKKDLNVPASSRVTTQTGHAIGAIGCNPVGQAGIFNEQQTDLNCVFGLCVGHDAIFMQSSAAPVVSLIVKDRANAHNPASILYGFYGDNFFHRRPSPEGAAEFNRKQIKPIDVFRMLREKWRNRK